MKSNGQEPFITVNVPHRDDDFRLDVAALQKLNSRRWQYIVDWSALLQVYEMYEDRPQSALDDIMESLTDANGRLWNRNGIPRRDKARLLRDFDKTHNTDSALARSAAREPHPWLPIGFRSSSWITTELKRHLPESNRLQAIPRPYSTVLLRHLRSLSTSTEGSSLIEQDPFEHASGLISYIRHSTAARPLSDQVVWNDDLHESSIAIAKDILASSFGILSGVLVVHSGGSMLGSYVWICQGTRPYSNIIFYLFREDSEGGEIYIL